MNTKYYPERICQKVGDCGEMFIMVESTANVRVVRESRASFCAFCDQDGH